MVPRADFRDAVVEQSKRVIAQVHGAGKDPVTTGVSYCLWREPREEGERMYTRMRALAMGVPVALGAMLGGIALACMSEAWPMRGGGIALGLFGVVCLFALPMLEGVIVVRRLKKQMPELWEAPEQLVPLRMENALTAKQLKISADDIGVIVPYPESGCLRIEGYRCRYLIYAQDVLRIIPGQYITVAYQVGSELLELSLRPDPFWGMTRQLKGAGPRNAAMAVLAIFGERIRELESGSGALSEAGPFGDPPSQPAPFPNDQNR